MSSEPRNVGRAVRSFVGMSVLALSACGSEPSASRPGYGVCDAEVAEETAGDTWREPSCALSCGQCEEEANEPWVCPALRPWRALPHDCAESACGKWDGRFPSVTPGKCVASAPEGAAIEKASPTADPVVLPDGRRLVPAGIERVLADAKVQGTFPASVLWVPGTRFAVVSDNGYADHVLRVLDVAKLAAGQDPIVSELAYPAPESLNYGLALAPDGTLFAASGAPDSLVRAFSLDANGVVAAQPSKDIPVQNAEPGDVFPSGIAVSPDGTKLAVAQVKERVLLVYDLRATSYGDKLASVDLGKNGIELLATYFDPASSDVVYVTAWSGERLFEVNLADLANPSVKEIPTGKQPEQIAFLSPTHLVVANSLSDDLSLVDRVSAQVVATIPVDGDSALRGMAPTALSFDPQGSRLYVALAGVNAVGVFDVTAGAGGQAPTLSLAGFVPTGWWPTAVAVADAPSGDPLSGSLLVLNGRGHGIGPETIAQSFASGINGLRMKGSAQLVSDLGAQALAEGTKSWEAAEAPGSLTGRSTVSCPDADYDFPIPATNEQGPSQRIEHVVFVVRENKTFDAIMGDMPGVDGDPSLVMAPGKMTEVWGNIRKVAGEFAHADNFYEDAEQSIQGHYWTVFGRSSDYTERAWLSIWGRGTRSLTSTASTAVAPLEGSVFQWLERSGIAYDNMGELYGSGLQDPRFGVVSTSTTIPDTKGACYVAARARITCNLKPFTYVWLVNDHTVGGLANYANPGAMIAVNDEATGMLIDGISHSPSWPKTLVVVIEDDPSDGADHVDAHRSIAVFASPWVKRGYVSKTHFDVSSLHKLFAHIFGIPYNNRAVAQAALPFDLFSATPDFTPYVYLPRSWTDLSCNPATSAYAVEAQDRGWDFADPDDQPGLSEQVFRMLRGEPDPD